MDSPDLPRCVGTRARSQHPRRRYAGYEEVLPEPDLSGLEQDGYALTEYAARLEEVKVMLGEFDMTLRGIALDTLRGPKRECVRSSDREHATGLLRRQQRLWNARIMGMPILPEERGRYPSELEGNQFAGARGSEVAMRMVQRQRQAHCAGIKQSCLDRGAPESPARG